MILKIEAAKSCDGFMGTMYYYRGITEGFLNGLEKEIRVLKQKASNKDKVRRDGKTVEIIREWEDISISASNIEDIKKELLKLPVKGSDKFHMNQLIKEHIDKEYIGKECLVWVERSMLSYVITLRTIE